MKTKIKVILILIVLLFSIIFFNFNALSETKNDNSNVSDNNIPGTITRNNENKFVISCNETYKIMNHDNRFRINYQINLTNYFYEKKIITLGRKDPYSDIIWISFHPSTLTLMARKSKIINLEMVATEESEIGVYNITIFAKDGNGDIKSNKLNLTVDLRWFILSSSGNDITFSKSNPEDGETIKIFVDIHNSGNEKAANISLKMYDNNKLLLTLNDISINANDSTTIVINWTATEGTHRISFNIDYIHRSNSKEINVREKEANYAVQMISIFILIIIIGIIIIWWKKRYKKNNGRLQCPKQNGVKTKQ